MWRKLDLANKRKELSKSCVEWLWQWYCLSDMFCNATTDDLSGTSPHWTQRVRPLSSSQSFDTTFARLFSFILLSPTLHTHSLILSFLLSYPFTWPYLILPIISRSLPHTLYLSFKTLVYSSRHHMTRGWLSTCMTEDDPRQPTRTQSEYLPIHQEVLVPRPQ